MRERIEKIFKDFNDNRKGEYIYVVDGYDNTIKEISLKDYSVCCICDVEDVSEITLEEDGQIIIDCISKIITTDTFYIDEFGTSM